MTQPLPLRPPYDLSPGRYHLDRDGQLHVRLIPGVSIAAVTVRMKSEPPTRSMARKPKSSHVVMPVEAFAPATEDDAAVAEFEAKLKAVRARRAKAEAQKPEPKVNAAAIAAAHRAKPLGPPPKRTPTRRALSDGECHRCGIRTTVGCDHFLPYLGDG